MWTSDCISPTALGTPTPDAGMPVATLVDFASYPPVFPIFGTEQPPAVMGVCGIHVGTNCNNSNGSTIDIVPRNLEFCIDSRPANGNQGRLVECDPAWNALTRQVNPAPTAVPIYVVREACVGYSQVGSGVKNVLIRLTGTQGANPQFPGQLPCSRYPQNGDLQIVLTHLVLDNTFVTLPDQNHFPILVQANTRIGFMCLSSEAVTPCGVNTADTPTHLAFQLQKYSGSSGWIQAPQDVLGYLAKMGCLYDDWASTNLSGSPQKQLSPVRACG